MKTDIILVALHQQLKPEKYTIVINLTSFFTASLSTLQTRKRELCWEAGGSCALE